MPNAHGCHCGADELWLGLDELIEVIDLVIMRRFGVADGQRMPEQEKAAIRARLETGRAVEGQDHDRG